VFPAPGHCSLHPCAEAGEEGHLPYNPCEKPKDRFEREREQDVGDQVETRGHGPDQPLIAGEQNAGRNPAADRDEEEHQYGEHGGY